MDVEKGRLIDALSLELIVDLTARLVAIPTPNPPGQERRARRLLRKRSQSGELKRNWCQNRIRNGPRSWPGIGALATGRLSF